MRHLPASLPPECRQADEWISLACQRGIGWCTKFSEGDAAGIFAVRNIGTSTGVIVDNINNTKLLYGTSSEGSTWTPEAAVTLYYYEDVTYVAYYPYKENITIDPTKSVNEITASFATKTELQPATDQSTDELYTASDLMTASGQATDSSDPTKKTLSLAFTHSYSLLVLKTNVAKAKYKAPDGSFKYHPKVTALNADATATDVVIMDIKAYKIANGVFRALIKPAPGDYILRVSCSKGTYIRVLAEDIGTALGVPATLAALRRTQAGEFGIEQCHTLPEILAAAESGALESNGWMLPIETVFAPLPQLHVDNAVKKHLLNGCPTSHYPAEDGRYRVYGPDGAFLGLAAITGGVLNVEKLFCERD